MSQDAHAERAWMEALFDDLWPLHRSITGDGLRASLDRIGQELPLDRMEVPTGTPAFDWQVPREWVVREAYLVGPDGRRVVDVQDHTLHLLNYSVPFRGRISRAELDAHLFSDPHNPDAIPYVTSYYQERWGFCLTHRQREALADGNYDVVIDTDLIDGALSYGEAVLDPTVGGTGDPEEILLSSHLCHPSMANDQLSGPIAAAALYRRLAGRGNRRHRFRLVLLPETIGSLTYLTRRGQHFKSRLAAGFVCVLAGGTGPFTYRRSRQGDSLADRAAIRILADMQQRDPDSAAADIRDFNPAFGNDQRQYCSPGFDLPVGCLTHTAERKAPEYHSSLDAKYDGFFENVQRCVDAYERIVDLLEANGRYRNLSPCGEPFLSKHGLYHTLNQPGLAGSAQERRQALMWVLNYSDGDHDLLRISEKSDLPFDLVKTAADLAVEAGLLERLNEKDETP